MRQSRPTTSSQAPHKSSNTTATQQQHNGNKKKPKYVKLTMSSKRFNMLALHVLPACQPPTPPTHFPPLSLLPYSLCQPVSFLCMRLQGKSFQSF